FGGGLGKTDGLERLLDFAAEGKTDELRAALRARGSESCAVGAILDAEGYSLLHWAALEGRRATVEALIDEFGVAVDGGGGCGDRATPLRWAAANGALAAGEALLARGADVRARDGRGDTAA